jgi:hypothetical protein
LRLGDRGGRRGRLARSIAVLAHAQEGEQKYLSDDEQDREQQEATAPASAPDSTDGSVGFHAAHHNMSAVHVDTRHVEVTARDARVHRHSRSPCEVDVSGGASSCGMGS